MPYALDVGRQALGFLRVDADDVTRSKRAFVYQAYRDHATRLYLVPFAAVHAMAAELGAVEQKRLLSSVLFVQSTGRCGSTLLSKLLHATCQSNSLSEPDVYTTIHYYHALSPNLLDRAEYMRLLRSVTLLLSLSSHAYRKIDGELLVVKLRSQLTIAADLYAEAVPESKVDLRLIFNVACE